MKLWAMPCRDTQDGWVMVESSDQMWSTGEGNGKPLQYSCLENPMNRMKRQKDRTLKDESPRSVGAQYATGDRWRKDSKKNDWNHNHRKLTNLITWTTAYLTQRNYEPCLVGPPKTDGSWWRDLIECGPLEKGTSNHFSILALRTPWTVWRGKKTGH